MIAAVISDDNDGIVSGHNLNRKYDRAQYYGVTAGSFSSSLFNTVGPFVLDDGDDGRTWLMKKWSVVAESTDPFLPSSIIINRVSPCCARTASAVHFGGGPRSLRFENTVKARGLWNIDGACKLSPRWTTGSLLDVQSDLEASIHLDVPSRPFYPQVLSCGIEQVDGTRICRVHPRSRKGRAEPGTSKRRGSSVPHACKPWPVIIVLQLHDVEASS